MARETDFTGPSSSNFALVSVFKGVDANTHTPPSFSWTAVDLPPMGIVPYRANGLPGWLSCVTDAKDGFQIG
jgi:hypothetical protein